MSQSQWAIAPRDGRNIFGLVGVQARSVFQQRHLVAFFATQAVRRLYKRTVLGVAWIFIRPLAVVAMGAVLFGGILGVNTDPIPYFLFFMVGTAGWQIFDSSLIWITRCLEANRRIIKKIYFPRIILPFAYITPALVECLIFSSLLLAAFAYYYWQSGTVFINFSPELWLIPLAVFMSILLALAIGLWTSVWGANVRDVRFVLRYILQAWYFFTPVIYPLAMIPEKWQWLVTLNPMTPIIESFRYGWLGIGTLTLELWMPSIVTIAVLLIGGVLFFVSKEAQAVDKL